MDFMELFQITVGRFYALLFNAPLATLYFFACTAVICFLYQVTYLRKERRERGIRLPAGHFALVYLFLFYLMLVYQVTGMGTVWAIVRSGAVSPLDRFFLLPFSSGSDPVPYILNVFMTTPLGFLLSLIWPSFRSVKKIALTGFLFSFAIELSQLLNIRATTLDDLVANTLGAVIGYLLFKYLYQWFGKGERKKRKPEIRKEAVIYLVASFLGVFFLYNF